MMTQADDGDHERDIARRIASLVDTTDDEVDSVAAELTELYRASIPVYDLVARDEVERNTRAVLDIVVRQVRGDAPTVDATELTDLVRRWSNQQIPLELVAHSIQVGARRLAKLVRSRAALKGMSTADVDDIADMMWEWATSYSAIVNAVMQENAVSRAAHRSTFMRRLVEDTHPAAALPSLLTTHGISGEQEYRVACADFDDPLFTSDVQATIRLRCATAEFAVFDAVVDSHFVALLPHVPVDLNIDALIAVGPAELVTSASASYQQARRTLDIAAQFGRSGVVDLARLGPLPLLVVDDDATRALPDIHLASLRDRSDAGQELLDTVTAYLTHNRRVDDTAAALFLHRNTVRNRVAKFTSLTGLDLDVTDDLVLTWWLVNRG